VGIKTKKPAALIRGCRFFCAGWAGFIVGMPDIIREVYALLISLKFYAVEGVIDR
jgi:hypothetical protein